MPFWELYESAQGDLPDDAQFGGVDLDNATLQVPLNFLTNFSQNLQYRMKKTPLKGVNNFQLDK
jgi:hypothetical protein